MQQAYAFAINLKTNYAQRMTDYINVLRPLADMVKTVLPDLVFNMVEIGALPLGNRAERFHSLLTLFPGSKVSAFELDELQCDQWNQCAPEGLRYYATALGSKNEVRPIYETQSSMCTSLYRPNAPLLAAFNRLDVVALKHETQVKTISLDQFIDDNNIGSIDFIKIDVQGAEYDIFKGGGRALSTVSFLVTEVEFVPLYEKQPLFGDVSELLASRGLMFHKFLALAGRPVKGLTVHGNPRHASQHLWSDAVYLPNVACPEVRSAEEWAKCALFAFMYGSSDMAYFCLQQTDKSFDSSLAEEFISRVSSIDFDLS